ncbi:MAG: MlaD family protein [Muribaculaceae bacterium]|nr:MlaD family protein [Muribaculaceae bacterium]
MKKIFRKEVLIGIIAIISIAILVIGIDFLKGINVFKPANYYYATYTNVEGLAISAPVTLNGYKVGLVREISYQYDNPGHVMVQMSLDKELRLPKGTVALLSTDLLGTAGIQLQPGTSSDIHTVGDHLTGENKKGLMDNIAGEMLPAVNRMIPKIDTLLTSVNSLVADPALAASIRRIDAITANLEASTRKLNAIMGTLPTITQNVNSITASLASSSADIAEISAGVKQMPLDSIADNIYAITTNLMALSEQLNDKNSTIGRIMNDPSLYDNLNNTISSLDSLFVDIKKNPKRYISIKLL